jgi:hypothetical protein
LENKRRIIIYYRKSPDQDRWFPGDRFIRPIIRYIIRGKKVSGLDKVFINLCKSFDLLKVYYLCNIPFKNLKEKDVVIVLGVGRYSLQGYNQKNKIIAGIGLMTHPSEWPDLCENYPIKKYLQHSEWASNVYKPYFGDNICDLWPAGIDTTKWSPTGKDKVFDFLIYIKIRWDKEEFQNKLIEPILQKLRSSNLSFIDITYGSYSEDEYYKKLNLSKALLFLTEHESQGIACCEAMSMNLPILAWDPEYCHDPNRFLWNDPYMPSSTVPFFDERCGVKFKDQNDFGVKLDNFLLKLGSGGFRPREYILEKISLEKSGERMLELIEEVYQ